ncbi:MAG: hypothetical protein ACTSPY_09400 [Candidatus Helarchaeota archaeon]
MSGVNFSLISITLDSGSGLRAGMILNILKSEGIASRPSKFCLSEWNFSTNSRRSSMETF